MQKSLKTITLITAILFQTVGLKAAIEPANEPANAEIETATLFLDGTLGGIIKIAAGAFLFSFGLSEYPEEIVDSQEPGLTHYGSWPGFALGVGGGTYLMYSGFKSMTE